MARWPSSGSGGPHAPSHATGGTDELTPTAIAALPAAQKGAANGVASLGADSKVPAAQLPASSGGGGGGIELPVGLYTPVLPSNNASVRPVKDREHALGFLLAPQTFDRIAFRVLDVGEAGAVFRVGIRADDGGKPGAPAVDSGTGVALGWNERVINYTHPGGPLWITWTAQTFVTWAPVIDLGTAYGLGLIASSPRTGFDWADGHSATTQFQEAVSGALPTTFTNVAHITTHLMTTVLRRSA